MKGFLNSLGWILFLALAALSLIFYNLSYLPIQAKVVRLEQEIKMWTQRVEELTDSLKMLTSGEDTIFCTSYRFDELFTSPAELRLSSQGETVLRGIGAQLRGGRVEVIGHTDSKVPPAPWRSNWDYSAAAAAVVARRLVSLGVPAERVVVMGAGDTRPLIPRGGADAQFLNRRVEIVALVR
ncbi:MAG: OmpA family protein [candidate division WOR-3 bacterium]